MSEDYIKINKFINFVIKRDINNSFESYKELQQNNESNIRLLNLLYNNFKTILLIQSCKSNDIAKTTGLNNNQIYYNKQNINYYTIGELVNILKLIQKIDEYVKIGNIDEDISINYLLVNIL